MALDPRNGCLDAVVVLDAAYEAGMVLNTFPGERVEGFYECGALDREDPNEIVRALAQTLGHDPDGPYADRLVSAHATRRYEFQTGHPF